MATTMSITRVFILFLVMMRSIVMGFGLCRDLPRLGKTGEFGFEIHYNTTRIQTADRPFYKLDAIVEWNEYNSTGETEYEPVSGYAVRMAPPGNKFRDQFELYCVNGFPGYKYTANTRFVFENLTYGYQYEFRIRTANFSTRKTSTQKQSKMIYTPDCYEATGDAYFCIRQPVQIASKPRDLVIDCSDIDSDNNITRVSVSWLAPLQVNGNLTKFLIHLFSNARRNPKVILPHTKVDQDTWNQSLSYRFNTTVLDLEVGRVYNIKVIPQVDGKSGHYFSSVLLNNETLDRPCQAEVSMATPRTESSVSGRGLRINPGLLAGLLCATVLLVVIIIGFVLLSRRRLSSTEKAIFVRYPDEVSTTYSCSLKKDTYHITTLSNGPSGPMMVEVDPVFYKMEFDRSLLKIEEILGSGQFGTVYKGFAYGIDGKEKYNPVAVKGLRENATRSMKEDFLDEIKLIVEIGSHPNILPILGCCTIEEPHYLIAELMKYGDLLHFLWKCREAKNGIEDPIYKLTATGQLQISIQVARGMEYLSTTLYYHGDLAARNVLVGDGLICKISDFGLADDIYQRGYKRLAPERKRPVKWVSLETNTQGKCSIQSDIWSFGIVLYEIYTLGGVPYPGMDGRQVITKLQQGYRMDRPTMCPEEIYDLMRSCWFESPHNRPTFTILYNALDAMLTKNVDYMTELETDYSVYEFVPCVDMDTCGDSETTGEGDNGLLPSISRELHARHGGKGCKFEAIRYKGNQQISQDSAFSEESALSGEPDELNLSWHLKEALRNDSNPLSEHSKFPSIEFVPIMDNDSESYSSGEPDELNLWWHLKEAMTNDSNPLSEHSKLPIIEFVPIMDYDSESASSSRVHSRRNSVRIINDVT